MWVSAKHRSGFIVAVVQTLALMLSPLLCIAQSTKATSPAPTAHSADLQRQIDSLKKKIGELDAELAILKGDSEAAGDIATLKGELDVVGDILNGKQDKNDEVLLHPSSRDFQRLDTNLGSFLVSIKDVSPYLNGYKIILNIGNPSAADFADATIHLKWGKPYNAKLSMDVWENSLRSQDTKLTTNLSSATWNTVEIILAPASPDELQYLRLSMDTPSVILRKDQ